MSSRNNQHNNYADRHERRSPIDLSAMKGAQLVQINLKAHPGPHANPICTVLPTQQGIELHSFGGFTINQDAAVRIAAGLAANPNVSVDDIPARAALLAEQTLLASDTLTRQRFEERQQQQQDQETENTNEAGP
ncbi:MAG: hypothetical protein AB7U73_01880 [Pirellulales bacterium]